MNKRTRVYRCIMGIALLVLGAGGMASAQDFPTRPIEIIVGAAAGGGGDLLARATNTYGAKYIGQQIITVDKPGAAGTIGSQFVASSKPDGYTLYLGGGSETLAAGHFRSLPFHPINDFESVIRLISISINMCVKANSPWKTFKDFLADAKANPGKYTYATTGVGSIHHSCMLVLEREAGISMRHVPFQGGAETVTALLGGHVDMSIVGSETAKLVEAGMVRRLANFDDKRNPLTPEVPTMREMGVNIYIGNMKGLMAPKGTPQPVIRKLHDGFRKVLDDSGFKSYLKEMQMTVAYLNGEDFGKAMTSMYNQIGGALKKK